VYKTTKLTMLAVKSEEVVLPHQALLVRVCGNGLRNENEIINEETEIHMHNTTPDVVHFCRRPEVISRTRTYHGSWSDDKMQEVDREMDQFREEMNRNRERIQEADAQCRRETATPVV